MKTPEIGISREALSTECSIEELGFCQAELPEAMTLDGLHPLCLGQGQESACLHRPQRLHDETRKKNDQRGDRSGED